MEHAIRGKGTLTTILEGAVKGERRIGRKTVTMIDDITGQDMRK